jgi:endoglucanase
MVRLSGLLAAIVMINGYSLAVGLTFADPAQPSFRRGATLVEFFQFPETVIDGSVKRYADPAYPQARSALTLFDYDELRKEGFDHMRVPIDIGPLLAGRGSQWPEIINELRTVIATLHRHGLGVVVTLFPPAPGGEVPMPQLDGLQGRNFAHYVAVVERIAAELGSVKTGAIALEPMNEPQEECRASSGPDWTAYQEVLVAHIRRIAPELPVFLTGGCWSHIEGTVLLDTPLLRDPRNFVSVHFYLPFLFTHQTATWAMPYMAGVIGVPYPAAAGSADRTLAATLARFATMKLSPPQLRSQIADAEREIHNYFKGGEGPAAMEQHMSELADWQKREAVPSNHIVFTEFGAAKQLDSGSEIERDLPSRARWLHDATTSMERHGWGWTVFVLRDGLFGLYDSNYDSGPDPRYLDALRLAPAVH